MGNVWILLLGLDVVCLCVYSMLDGWDVCAHVECLWWRSWSITMAQGSLEQLNGVVSPPCTLPAVWRPQQRHTAVTSSYPHTYGETYSFKVNMNCHLQLVYFSSDTFRNKTRYSIRKKKNWFYQLGFDTCQNGQKTNFFCLWNNIHWWIIHDKDFFFLFSCWL